ncbi:SRPBCC family protein [Streptomyces sp. NPDC007264]|uniref:SRPBCC family protein n=1 Tax=Streptomyces sp. NPDC007264 TaxID=3364777 RepID=UPI0036DA5679
MKHEVFVPVPAERLREALADPARVARAIPGLHQDAGTRPVAGRLKVRVGGHTITYRGTLRVAERGDGSFTAQGEASEARGTGTVELSLSVRVLAAEGGATVVFTGTATGDGRIAELPEEAVASAGARLLGRFAENLCGPTPDSSAAGPTPDETPAGPTPDEAPAGEPAAREAAPEEPVAREAVPEEQAGAGRGGAEAGATPDEVPAGEPAAETAGEPVEEPAAGAAGEPAAEATGGPAGESAAEATGEAAGESAAEAGQAAAEPPAQEAEEPSAPSAEEPSAPSVFDAEVPPSPLDPLADEEGPDGGAAEPPAEAAHARRTMIGRSAEEVDHAPPRGRYAPVPSAEPAAATATLRWAAPAAALIVATAIVAGRLLRRRR